MLRRISVAIAACMLVAAVATSTLIAAAPGKKPGARQGAAVQRMTLNRFAVTLNLTQAQTQQVNSIIARLRTDVRAAVATYRSREDKMAAVLQLRNVAKENISALLTAEQKEKAESRRMIDRLLSPGRAGHRQKLMAKLDLSPEQKTQIEAVMKQTMTQMKALRADTGLTPEARKARAQEIRQSGRDSISALLTPEQRDKLLRWRQNRPAGMQGRVGDCPMGCGVGRVKQENS